MAGSDGTAPAPGLRLRRIAGLAAAGTGLVVLWLIGPLWVTSWWNDLTAETRRGVSIGFLQSVLVGYGAALVLAPATGAFALARLLRGRSRGLRRPLAARVLALSVSTLLGLGMLEAGAWGFAAWQTLPPPVPTPPPPPTEAEIALAKLNGMPLERHSADELLVLVLGESSAEGQPFHPWLSIGHILAWQIEEALPGRKVRVKMAATGGVPLANTIQQMANQTERPDVVVLVAGHNEFQARWGWTRVVNYYADDILERPREGLADRVGEWTPLTAMIRDAADRQRVDRRPSPAEIRAVVERPVCEPQAREGVRRLFEEELELVASWSERSGALPIFVAPAGNDVGFDPDRSIMTASTRKADRLAFGRDFAEAKAVEAADPAAAEPLYRALIARQPGFAEAHYRLARVLQARGAIPAARAEYALARDLDAMPMRCPSDLRALYPKVAARHDLILVDAAPRLERLSPTGLLDDHVFHDAQHPTFRAYVDLAQAAMDGLWARGALGLPKGPAPQVDPDACAEHFRMDNARWAEACWRSYGFWSNLARVRYDSEDRKAHAERFRKAAKAIAAGATPESTGVPGLGVHPEGLP